MYHRNMKLRNRNFDNNPLHVNFVFQKYSNIPNLISSPLVPCFPKYYFTFICRSWLAYMTNFNIKLIYLDSINLHIFCILIFTKSVLKNYFKIAKVLIILLFKVIFSVYFNILVTYLKNYSSLLILIFLRSKNFKKRS